MISEKKGTLQFFEWHSAHNSLVQPLLLSVFMQFKLPDGHDSFTLLLALLSKSLNMLKFPLYATYGIVDIFCHIFREEDTLS